MPDFSQGFFFLIEKHLTSKILAHLATGQGHVLQYWVGQSSSFGEKAKQSPRHSGSKGKMNTTMILRELSMLKCRNPYRAQRHQFSFKWDSPPLIWASLSRKYFLCVSFHIWTKTNTSSHFAVTKNYGDCMDICKYDHCLSVPSLALQSNY